MKVWYTSSTQETSHGATMNTMRWRYGDTNPVYARAKINTRIESGDLVYLVGDYIEPYTTGRFEGVFLGCAMTSSKVGDTVKVRIATTGVFDFDWEDEFINYTLGEFVRPIGNQAVETTNISAIGRIASQDSSEHARVKIHSICMDGPLK